MCLFKFLEEKRPGSGMLADSNVLRDLEAHAYSTTGEVMSIYGDPTDSLRVQPQAPYRNPNTPEMQKFQPSNKMWNGYLVTLTITPALLILKKS